MAHADDAPTGFEVVPVPCLDDNFAYLLIDLESSTCAAVDPVEPQKVVDAAKRHRLNPTITHVLTTHKHWDHAGGNVELKKLIPSIEVLGGKGEGVAGCTREVAHGDVVQIGKSTQVDVMIAPCHTRAHALYVASSAAAAPAAQCPKALFCGDTLFIGGCGRFFEGSAEQMHTALNEYIAGLPDSCQVFCGHDYTVANLKFARTVEPDSAAIRAKLAWAEAEIAQGKWTVPSTVGQEKTFNVFMRVSEPSVRSFTGTETDVDTMRELREKKNGFRPS